MKWYNSTSKQTAKNIRMYTVISRATIKKIMQIDITKEAEKIKIQLQKILNQKEQKPEGQTENKIKWQS